MAVHTVDVTGVKLPAPPLVVAPESPVWIRVRPDIRRSATLATDILCALGKRLDVSGKGRNENADIELATAWIKAYGCNHLVLTDSQNLHHLMIAKVVRWTRDASIDLWLLHRAPRTDAFCDALARQSPHELPLANVPRATPRPPAGQGRPTLGVDIPMAPLHEWRRVCTETLTPTGRVKVQRRHDATYTRAMDQLDLHGPTVESVARIVETILAPAPHDDVLVTDIRALQLACWQHGHYLRSDLPILLASEQRPTDDPRAVDALMTAYKEPYRALTVALTSQQVGQHHQRQLRRSAVTDDLDIRLPDGRLVSLLPHARRALTARLAQLDERTDTALLPNQDRVLSNALIQARDELGVIVHGRRAERSVQPHNWLRRLGLTLFNLEGSHRC